jgi:hypothetical protein
LLQYTTCRASLFDLIKYPETLLISLIGTGIVSFLKQSWLVPAFVFITGVFITEVIASAAQKIKRFRRGNVKVILCNGTQACP